MSIALDGFELLRRLGEHADTFAVVRADVDKQARALVVKCLKSKSIGFDALGEIYKALGEEPFGLLLDGLKDAEVKSIVTRLDKHHPELKGGAPAWHRKHLKALAEGTSHPSAPPAKPVKKPKASKKASEAEPPRLHSEVMDVFRQGGKGKS
jgi:hypothetical protein